MGAGPAVGAVPDASTPRTPPRAEPDRRRLVMVVLVTALAGATWLLSPQAFPSTSGYSTEWQDPLAPDAPVLLDLGGGSDRDVELLQVRPRVSGGPSSAVRVAVCSRTAEVGMARGPLPEGCSPVDERPLLRRAGEDPATAEHLALVVDPVPGATVVVDGADVLYRDGIRLGYQHVGGHHTVPFAPAG